MLPAETQQTLLTTAAGNPLYAEEYVRMLIDRGYLHREGAGWQLTADGRPAGARIGAGTDRRPAG